MGIRCIHNCLYINITEVCYFFLQMIVYWKFRPAYYHIGSYTCASEFLGTVLCWFGLEFTCSTQIWYVGYMDEHNIFRSLLISELTKGFKEGLAFYVSNGSTNLHHDNLCLGFICDFTYHRFYFICYVWNDLDT